jgi:hypothetical protein
MLHLTHSKPHPLSLRNPGLRLRRAAHRDQELLLEHGVLAARAGELGDGVEAVRGLGLQMEN